MSRRVAVRPPKTSERLTIDAIDHGSPTPLYRQVVELLRAEIHSGRFAPGALLPGEKDLTEHLGLSRITVKRALNELAAQGLVARQRGRGTSVTYNPAAPVVSGSFENLIDSLKLMGLSTSVRLVLVEERPASEAIADLLGVPHGAVVQRAIRVRQIEGESFSHLVTHVPLDVARKFDPSALAFRPLLQLLEEAGFRCSEAEQWITAVSASPEIARALGIAPGAPLLRTVRVMRDEAGRVVEALEGHYRPDRFQHHMRLTRRKGRGGRSEWR